jgi:flagellar motor switch protein FliG
MARLNAITTRLNALTGPEKVAIVMLAVGNDLAGKLIKRFEEDEQREVVRAMATMGLVSADMVERLLASVIERLDNPSVYGSLAQAEQILLTVMPPEKVRQFLDDLRGPSGRNTWDKLQAVPDSQMVAFLRAESPQTASFVITKLPAAQAARVLGLLPAPLAEDIVKRMINLTPVAKPVLDDVERVLRAEFLLNIGQNRQIDNHAAVAEIFNHLDNDLEDAIFTALDEEMPDSAERIRALMFTFDDLRNIDEAGIQILLREIPAGVLPLALKGARVEMVDVFLRHMGERAGRMMQDEIAAMPKARARDVEDARRQIVEICKDLIARGEIASEADEEEEWIA